MGAAQKQLPDGLSIEEVKISGDSKKAWTFWAHEEEKTPGWTSFSETKHHLTVYVDPYTARVTGVVDQETNWINLLRVMHQQLLVNYEVGHLVVGISTLMMFLMVLTGLILWWPRNKGALKQRFSVKLRGKWRRANYDIHSVGGFYVHILILIFATTGLVWTFDWWTDGIYRVLGDDPKAVFKPIPQPDPDEAAVAQPLDISFADLRSKKSNWHEISFFVTPKKVTGVVRYDGDSGWDTWDIHHYNAKSGALFHSITHEDKSVGAKWRNSNYAIHVGSIYGVATKILATLTALFCASLPVSGFYIWWGRRKKAKVPGRIPRRKLQHTKQGVV